MSVTKRATKWKCPCCQKEFTALETREYGPDEPAKCPKCETNCIQQDPPKAFALICKTFGRKFSFNATSQDDAESKARGWCLYHSFSFVDFSVEEIERGGDLQDLHNEYVRGR